MMAMRGHRSVDADQGEAGPRARECADPAGCMGPTRLGAVATWARLLSGEVPERLAAVFALQTTQAATRSSSAASSSALCVHAPVPRTRLTRKRHRQKAGTHAPALHQVPMQQFIASHAKAPKELVLDVDAAHVPLRGERGANPRFVVTDLPGSPKALYERRYCARGEAENRFEEAQLVLLGRRVSCHRFQSNQLRLLLAALAYTLMINLRRLGLQGTELALACTATIRTKLLKIGAAVLRKPRRVRVLLASAHPMHHVFPAAAPALGPCQIIQRLARALTPNGPHPKPGKGQVRPPGRHRPRTVQDPAVRTSHGRSDHQLSPANPSSTQLVNDPASDQPAAR